VTRFTHNEWREQAAAYALDALARDERVDFEAHLLECGECDEEVRSFVSVATALAAAAPSIPPDRRVRDKAVAAATRAPAPVEIPPPVAPRRARAVLVPWLAAAASLAIAAAIGMQLLSVRRIAHEGRSAVVVLGAEDLVRVDLAGQGSHRAHLRAHSGAVREASS
jgi:anti-sigma factor RsiW